MTPAKRRTAPPSGASGTPRAAAQPGPLFTIPDELFPTTFLRRPSERNRSPYVADVRLACGRVAICHVPSFDMGGKLAPGSMLLVKAARTAKGVLVGKDAVSPKYGTPKCEFISQLLLVDEPESAAFVRRSDFGMRSGGQPGDSGGVGGGGGNDGSNGGDDSSHGGSLGVWVGAHPSLGEKVAAALIETGILDAKLGIVSRVVGGKGGATRKSKDGGGGSDMPWVTGRWKAEVKKPFGLDMRVDFELTRQGGGGGAGDPSLGCCGSEGKDSVEDSAATASNSSSSSSSSSTSTSSDTASYAATMLVEVKHVIDTDYAAATAPEVTKTRKYVSKSEEVIHGT